MYQQKDNGTGAKGCGPSNFRPNFGYGFTHPMARGNGYRRPKYNVPINVTESDTEFKVEVFAVGFTKNDITVRVIDDVLYISGRKEIETSPNFTLQEFPVKAFERKLSLNGLVDIENINARSEDSVLVITLPKTMEAQKKEQKIEVQ